MVIENRVKICYLSLYFLAFIKEPLKNVLGFKKEQMKTVPNENKQIFKEIYFTP